MSKVISKDGTEIGYSKAGRGDPVILVDGAMCYRELGPAKSLAAELADKFTVYTYDRRGRGDSGNTLPYAVEREIEDIDALIRESGESAYLCGFSSGAALALEAARSGLSIKKLALYEAPFIVDDSRAPVPHDFIAGLKELLKKDDRGQVVKRFLKLVGMPSLIVPFMPLMPGWRKLKGTAHTIPYDLTIVSEHQRGLPLAQDQWNSIQIPTTVFVGGKSPDWMRNGTGQLAEILPNAELRTLIGQTHMVKAKAFAPALTEFLLAKSDVRNENSQVAVA
jgi:pimeloyl-ACP methyl ester carboxylesterase